MVVVAVVATTGKAGFDDLTKWPTAYMYVYLYKLPLPSLLSSRTTRTTTLAPSLRTPFPSAAAHGKSNKRSIFIQPFTDTLPRRHSLQL